MLSAAVLCAAHARLARRREWVLSEKGLVRRAGLEAAHPVLTSPGEAAAGLTRSVAALAALLGVDPLDPR
jgi:hypothetical protein